jgi:hypothetical protein
VRSDQEHLLERGDALGGLALLVETEDGVEHGQAEDRDPRRELLERDDAHDRGAEKHVLHEVAVLAQEGVPARFLRRFSELVRPVLRAPLLDLARVEAGCGIDTQPRRDFVGGRAVPRAPCGLARFG